MSPGHVCGRHLGSAARPIPLYGRRRRADCSCNSPLIGSGAAINDRRLPPRLPAAPPTALRSAGTGPAPPACCPCRPGHSDGAGAPQQPGHPATLPCRLLCSLRGPTPTPLPPGSLLCWPGLRKVAHPLSHRQGATEHPSGLLSAFSGAGHGTRWMRVTWEGPQWPSALHRLPRQEARTPPGPQGGRRAYDAGE